MRPQTLLYQRLLGRTSVRPYVTNLDQPIFETVSGGLPEASAPKAVGVPSVLQTRPVSVGIPANLLFPRPTDRLS